MTASMAWQPLRILPWLWGLVGLAAAATAVAGPGEPAATGATSAPTIFMVGDSTMANKPLQPAQPERGWGQMLPAYFQRAVRLENLAMNGRSSKSFRDEGRWQPVLDQLRPGDFVILQFGHNDEKRQDPKRGTEPFGSFQENLERYIREVREHGSHPILATPVVRRAFTNQTELRDTHGDYATAVRRVAAAQSVPLLDLEKRSRELVSRLGPEVSKKLYLWISPGEYASLPEGKQDDTHFGAYGASRMCDLAVEEIKVAAPKLADWLATKR